MRTVRIFFKKQGNMKFISHLDMNRFMIKMVRRSKIPVWYSEGFNPHPYITFALPLSLGFESDYEVVDMRIEDENFTNDMVKEALKANMPEGIDIFDCREPLMKAGAISYADFSAVFDQDLPLEALNAFLASEDIPAEKKTKKGKFKQINLKEYVKDFEIGDRELRLTVSAGSGNNLNPKLLLEAFEKNTGHKLPAYSINRTMLYNENMEIFK